MEQPPDKGSFAARLAAAFADCADLCVRSLTVGDTAVTLLFLDGLCSGEEIALTVLRPLLERAGADNAPRRTPGTMTDWEETLLCAASVKRCATPGDAADAMVRGFCVLLRDGADGALAVEVKGGQTRGVAAPETESTVKGAKDAFTETLRTNTALLRRHLRTPELRIWETGVGRRSQTAVSVLWLDGLTDPRYVSELQTRLRGIDVDGFVTPAAVEEYVTGSRATAFPLLQSTQRSDRLATGLLEGRVGLLVDGLPTGWLLPVDLGYLMAAAEDRGTDYLSASLVRLLRYLALLVSLLLPAFYVAMAEFHQEMIPTALLRAMIESKRSVPFPTVLELLGLLLAFEVLQEAGMTLPQAISQTVSIIGGLVIGTAAVEADLISPAALIVVAVAGICGYALPGKELSDAVRLWRLGLTVLASFAGMLALTLGALALLLRLASLESLGLPYLAPFSGLHGGMLIRPRLAKQPCRDPLLHPLDLRNQAVGDRESGEGIRNT